MFLAVRRGGRARGGARSVEVAEVVDEPEDEPTQGEEHEEPSRSQTDSQAANRFVRPFVGKPAAEEKSAMISQA